MVRSLSTIPQFSQKYPSFSEPALRKIVFDAASRINSKGENIPGNGFARAILRVGRKVLIDETAFFGVIDEKNCRRAPAPRELEAA